MKKIFIFLMSALMIIGLASCGTNSDEPNDSISIVNNAIKTNEVLTLENPVTVVDNEFCTFTINEVVYNKSYDTYGLKVYLENKTNEKLHFAWENVAVNEYMCDNYWGADVMPNKKENTEILWDINVFDENGIDYKNISNIEFELIIASIDDEFYLQDFYVKDVYALNIA